MSRASDPRPTEIVIEINERRIIKHKPTMDRWSREIMPAKDDTEVGNGAVQFPPAATKIDTLRSRWVPQRETGKQHFTQMQRMPEIPGQRIHLDMEARTGRITDALTPEMLKKIHNLVEQINSEEPGYDWMLFTQPHPTIEWPTLSEDDVIYWAAFMSKLLEEVGPADFRQKYADPVQNCHKLLSFEEYVKTGKLKKPYIHGEIYRTTEWREQLGGAEKPYYDPREIITAPEGSQPIIVAGR